MVRTQQPDVGSQVEFSPDGNELLTSPGLPLLTLALTSGNVVLDPVPNAQTSELSKRQVALVSPHPGAFARHDRAHSNLHDQARPDGSGDHFPVRR